MPSYLPLKIFALISLAVLPFACKPFDVTIGTDKAESLADIKKRLWLQSPPDSAASLRTILNFEINKKLPIGRPVSFVISDDDALYVNDNINGKLFKIAPDFETIIEFGTTPLSSPTRIREFDAKLFVYDNRGINVFNNDGQFLRTIKPFLKLEDFDLLDAESYVVNLAERKIDNGGSYFAILDAAGKRQDSIGKLHVADYPDIENRVFLEARAGKLYVGYKYEPAFEIYDLKDKTLLHTFRISSNIFPPLLALKQEKEFAHPEPGIFRIGKFIAGFKVVQDKLYVLLHTPNPEIVEFTLDGKEVQRFISKETQALDYFGFDVRLNNDTKRFFVGAIDYSGNPSIVVYEENGTSRKEDY